MDPADRVKSVAFDLGWSLFQLQESTDEAASAMRRLAEVLRADEDLLSDFHQ